MRPISRAQAILLCHVEHADSSGCEEATQLCQPQTRGWVKPGTQPMDTPSFKCKGLPLNCYLNPELSLPQVPSSRLILFATAMSHPVLCPGQASPVKPGRGPCHGSIPGLLLPPWRHLHINEKFSTRSRARPDQEIAKSRGPYLSLTEHCFYSSTCNNIKA